MGAPRPQPTIHLLSFFLHARPALQSLSMRFLLEPVRRELATRAKGGPAEGSPPVIRVRFQLGNKEMRTWYGQALGLEDEEQRDGWRIRVRFTEAIGEDQGIEHDEDSERTGPSPSNP